MSISAALKAPGRHDRGGSDAGTSGQAGNSRLPFFVSMTYESLHKFFHRNLTHGPSPLSLSPRGAPASLSPARGEGRGEGWINFCSH